jgi:hypothetical protein
VVSGFRSGGGGSGQFQNLSAVAEKRNQSPYSVASDFRKHGFPGICSKFVSARLNEWGKTLDERVCLVLRHGSN